MRLSHLLCALSFRLKGACDRNREAYSHQSFISGFLHFVLRTTVEMTTLFWRSRDRCIIRKDLFGYGAHRGSTPSHGEIEHLPAEKRADRLGRVFRFTHCCLKCAQARREE